MAVYPYRPIPPPRLVDRIEALLIGIHAGRAEQAVRIARSGHVEYRHSSLGGSSELAYEHATGRWPCDCAASCECIKEAS